MDNVVLRTARTEMKFPLQLITPQTLVNAIGDEETIQFMAAIPTMNYTEETAEGFLDFLAYTSQSDTELELGIFDNETNRFIGMCALENINREYCVCELGYWLDKEYVGRGYMTECAKEIIRYAKEELHMKAINAFVIVEHKKSIALLERLGFTRKQLLTSDIENKGKSADRYWYKLVL